MKVAAILLVEVIAQGWFLVNAARFVAAWNRRRVAERRDQMPTEVTTNKAAERMLIAAVGATAVSFLLLPRL